jgi:hypothetical protein
MKAALAMGVQINETNSEGEDHEGDSGDSLNHVKRKLNDVSETVYAVGGKKFRSVEVEEV